MPSSEAAPAADLKSGDVGAFALVDIDVVPVAWRLVVDRKAPIDLLLHLDPVSFFEAAARVLGGRAGADVESLQGIAAVADMLAKKQAGMQPDPIWSAWMHNVHAARVEALKRKLLPAAEAAPVRQSAPVPAATPAMTELAAAMAAVEKARAAAPAAKASPGATRQAPPPVRKAKVAPKAALRKK